jgi:hypothetical protein
MEISIFQSGYQIGRYDRPNDVMPSDLSVEQNDEWWRGFWAGDADRMDAIQIRLDAERTHARQIVGAPLPKGGVVTDKVKPTRPSMSYETMLAIAIMKASQAKQEFRHSLTAERYLEFFEAVAKLAAEKISSGEQP